MQFGAASPRESPLPAARYIPKAVLALYLVINSETETDLDQDFHQPGCERVLRIQLLDKFRKADRPGFPLLGLFIAVSFYGILTTVDR